MATSKCVSRIAIKTCKTKFVNYYRRFCTETKSEKTEPFFMSGYQALQKKQHKIRTSQLEWAPETLTLQQNKWIMEASKPHEVMSIVKEALTSNLEQTQMTSVFNCAIRKCVELNAYPQCWTLFVSAKNTNHISSQVYTTMIWMCLNSSRRAHFDKALNLYNEMKAEGLPLTSYTYTALLNGSAKKLCLEQGVAIWKDMQNDTNFTPDSHAWNAVLRLYCSNIDMLSASQAYHDMKHKANIAPDSFTFSTLLNGYSKAITNVLKFDLKDIDTDDYVTRGDNVFYDAVIAWQENASNECTPSESVSRLHVIQAWLNLYASNGDVYSCLSIFKWLLKTDGIDFEYPIKMSKKRREKVSELETWLYDEENELNRGRYPMKIQIIGMVLKSCLNKPNLSKEKLKGVIESVMDCLKNKCAIKPSTDIYGILFQLYKRMVGLVDVKELETLYQEMKNECYSKPTERELNDYGRTYLYFIDHNGGSTQQKKDFVSTLIGEFKELKVTPSIYTKQLIEEQYKAGASVSDMSTVFAEI